MPEIAHNNPTAIIAAEMQRTAYKLAQRERKNATLASLDAATLSLAQFVEATSALKLDYWQLDLCNRLQELTTSRGKRIAVHVHPQAGKSVIVSQRLPAYLLRANPLERVKLACYNVTHAARFGRVVRDLMISPEVRALVPDPDLRVPPTAGGEEWSTAARSRLRDAQPSFKALGLATGFIGQGADTLIVDDPYASPDEALSPLINDSIWRFWTDTAKPRVTENTNVVVMFHRYAEHDLAGRLLEEGGWELWRYAAIADGDYEHPITRERWPDPLQRQPGEKLSPRFSDQYYQDQQKNGYVWLSQFQGRPTAREGSFFKVGKFKYLDSVHDLPQNLRLVRAWDLAATEGAGDWTAGVLMGADDATATWYVIDLVLGQWDTHDRDEIIKQTAQKDGPNVFIRGAQDPGSAGVTAARAFTSMLAGYGVRTEKVSGSKESRAQGFSSQVNGGNVYIVRGPWRYDFIEQLRQFPMGAHDDVVDSVSDSFNELVASGGFKLDIIY